RNVLQLFSMFDAVTETPDAPAPPAETRAERRMRRLEQMSEIGLSLGRKLERQADIVEAQGEVHRLDGRARPQLSPRPAEPARRSPLLCRAVTPATMAGARIDQALPAAPELARAWRRREEAGRDKREHAAVRLEQAIDADPAIATRRRAVDLKIHLHKL